MKVRTGRYHLSCPTVGGIHGAHDAMKTLKRGCAVLALSIVTGVSGTASAGTSYTGIKNLHNHQFIYFAVRLEGGRTTTLETRNLTRGDTVMHLLYRGRSVAADDDGGVGRASRIDYKPTSSGYYYILVHSYSVSHWGTADIYINGRKRLENQPFGGMKNDLTWHRDDEIRVTAVSRDVGTDTMTLSCSVARVSHTPSIGAATVQTRWKRTPMSKSTT